MTLQTGCAMDNAEDVATLNLGFVIRHPNDEVGRPVLFIDRSSMTQSQYYSRDSYLRVLWYMVHTLSMEDSGKYQMTGYIILLNLTNYDPVGNKMHGGDRVGANKTFDIIRDLSSLRLKSFHLLFSSRQNTILNILFPTIRAMHGRYIRLHSIPHYDIINTTTTATKKSHTTATTTLVSSNTASPRSSVHYFDAKHIHFTGGGGAAAVAVADRGRSDSFDNDEAVAAAVYALSSSSSPTQQQQENTTTKHYYDDDDKNCYLDTTALCQKYNMKSQNLSHVIGGKQTIQHHLDWIERQTASVHKTV